MKTRKVLSFLTAAVMTAASLPVLSGFAADNTVTLGDVDQDGYITGHDSAMVTRYLHVDAKSLTDEQLQLADVNQDGVVDQTDADLIHAQEVYCIGDSEMCGVLYASDAWRALMVYAAEMSGSPIQVVEKGISEKTHFTISTTEISQVEYNLLDVNADGTVTLRDAENLLCAYCNYMVGGSSYFNEERYDLYDGAYHCKNGLDIQ